MSEPEVRRAGAFQRVKSQDLKLVEAAEVLGLSYRPAKRQYGGYRQGGSQALVHGNAGKPSNQAKRAKVSRPALALVKNTTGQSGLGVQYACRWLQIEAEGPQTRVPAGSTVLAREHRDGSLSLLWNHRKLRWHELAGRQATAGNPETARGAAAEAGAPHHPWRTSPAVTPWR